MTFSDLKAAVEALAPTQLDDTTAGQIVNRAYRSLYRLRNWVGTRQSGVLATVPDKTTGTVTLTPGSTSVPGAGTSFTSTDAGRYVVVAGAQPVRIASVNVAGQILTLQQSWGGTLQSGIACVIRSLRYTLPAGAEQVIAIRTQNWPLSRTNLNQLDLLDPRRDQQGDPFNFVDIEIVGGGLEVELWPIPNTTQVLRLWTRAILADLSANTDTPVIPSAPLQSLAQIEACKALKARTGDASWDSTVSEFRKEYESTLAGAIAQDRRQYGGSLVAMDSDNVAPDLSAMGWARQMNAYWQRF